MNSKKKFYVYSVENNLVGKSFFEACLDWDVGSSSYYWQKACDLLSAWEGEHLQLLKASSAKLADYYASGLKHKFRYELNLKDKNVIKEAEDVIDGICVACKEILVRLEVDGRQSDLGKKSLNLAAPNAGSKEIGDWSVSEDSEAVELQEESVYIPKSQPIYNPVWSSVLAQSNTIFAKWAARGILVFMFVLIPLFVLIESNRPKNQEEGYSVQAEQNLDPGIVFRDRMTAILFDDLYCSRQKWYGFTKQQALHDTISFFKKEGYPVPKYYDEDCIEIKKFNERMRRLREHQNNVSPP